MVRRMPGSQAAPDSMRSPAVAQEQVRSRFRRKAREFDDLYDDQRPLMRLLRPGLIRRRDLAVATALESGAPRVLDVGCGSGRVGELVLEANAARYLGIDFSESMIELARARLSRFADRAELVVGEFLESQLDGPFDVILALGLFDYLPEPHRFVLRMHELAAPGGCVVGSFPTWSLLKGPVRKIRYEWIGQCPIFNYSQRELQLMFGAAGFSPVEIRPAGPAGFLVRGYKASRGAGVSTSP